MVYYKVATATEAGAASISVSTGTVDARSAHTVYRIAKETYAGNPVAAANAMTSSTNPNPPNLTTGWGAVDTLWIAGFAGTGIGTGTDPAVTAPTNFSDNIDIASGGSSTAASTAAVASARRILNAASLDPGTFSFSNSTTHRAFTIGVQGPKPDPTLSISNSPQTYSGSPIAATVTCSSGGAVSDIKYDGSSNAPTNAGTYAVTADCAETSGFAALDDASAGDFVISQATPTASITNSPVTYNGSEQTATVSCLGGGTATLASGGVGTDAGSYPATVDCAESTNYAAATGLAAGDFVINRATPTASITNSPVTYDGSEQTATVSCLGGGTATLASGGVGTDAGSYPATVDCAESTNYAAATGLAAGDFVINRATPTASITNSPVTYDGSEQTATVSCLGGGTATLASGGVGTNVGSYPATVDCAESTNYAAATGLAAGDFVIKPNFDLDGNDEINDEDVISWIEEFLTGTPPITLADFNGDGNVDVRDFFELIAEILKSADPPES